MLIYIAYIDRFEEIGVYKKILSQCNEFSKYHETILIYKRNNDICVENITFKKTQLIEKVFVNESKGNKVNIGISKYKNLVKFNSFIEDFIRKNKPQILYIRKYNLLFSGIDVLRCAKKNLACHIICEIPTYPYKSEFIRKKRQLIYLYYRYLDNRIEKIADKIAVVLGNDVNLDKRKYMALMNGIDTSSIVLRKRNGSNKALNLLGVAHVAAWHGYDRIIEGLKDYYNNDKCITVDVNFHIVGNGVELCRLNKIVGQYNLKKHVFFYGTKTGQELNEVFDKCDIGIGSLANHRKGLTKESALKSREYCARGIPFIISSDDDGFNSDFKYRLKIEPDESPVNINKIIEFYDSIKDCNYVEEMRSYAESNLTWEAVMKPVIDAII